MIRSYPLVNVCSPRTGKSPSLIAKSSISTPFSIAMLNYQRVPMTDYETIMSWVSMAIRHLSWKTLPSAGAAR